MLDNEIMSIFKEETGRQGADNAEALESIYYEYHGCYDEGNNIADMTDKLAFEERLIA